MSLETKDLVAAIKRRPLVFVCGTICVVLALSLYFRMGLLAEARTKLDEREKELARLSNNVKFSAQLDAQLEALRKANAALEAGALRASELARNQQLFLELESATGVKLLDLRQAPVPVAGKAAAPAKGAAPTKGPAPGRDAASTFVFIPVTLTVEAEYEKWIEFLKKLERSSTLSRVSSASVGQPGESGENGVQSVSLTVELLGFRS